jgi:amino acid transporter
VELTAIGIEPLWRRNIRFRYREPANHAGPALALSFVIAELACVFAACVISEFALLPVEGSAYAYAYGQLENFGLDYTGWGLILEYAMGSNDRRRLVRLF